MAMLRRGLISGVEYACFQWPSLVQPEHGILLDEFQQDIINSAFTNGVTEIPIKGCAKAGKGAAVAIVANIWFRVFKRARIVLTGPKFSEVRDNLFGEIVRWRRQMRDPGPGDILDKEIKHEEHHELVIEVPNKGESFTGRHGPDTLFIFEEASGIDGHLHDLAGTQARLRIYLSNPRSSLGWFRKLFPMSNPDVTQTIETAGGKRRCVSIDGEDLRNVRDGMDIIPNQLKRSGPMPSYEALKSHRDKRWVDIFAHGKFPPEDFELGLFFARWFERCHKLWSVLMRMGPQEIPIEAAGFDVSGSESGDLNVLALGGKIGVHKLVCWNEPDPMASVGKVARLVKDNYKCAGIPIVVDWGGMGRAVGFRMREVGLNIIEHDGNARSERNPLRYRNMRAEVFGELSERLDDSLAGDPWALPDDPVLIEDLCAHERIYDSSGVRFQITPKRQKGGKAVLESGDEVPVETIMQKLGRSPDRADAVTMLYRAVQSRMGGADSKMFGRSLQKLYPSMSS